MARSNTPRLPTDCDGNEIYRRSFWLRKIEIDIT